VKDKARFGRFLPAALGMVALCMAGCAPPSGSGGGTGGGGTGGGGTGSTALTGNWSFQVNPTGTAPFTYLSGFVDETSGGVTPSTTASLQVQSNSCFANTKVLDLAGYTDSNLTQLNSFPSYDQTVSFGLSTQCSAGISLCGTYSVAGGCGAGETGQVLGTLYTPLNGTFQTGSTASPTLSLVISQSPLGSGEGTFEVSGTLAFTGASCLTTATIDSSQSYLSGSTLSLVATTNAVGGALLSLNGTMNPAASTIKVNTIDLAGNTCLSSLTGVTLTN
jgi:hypothetical protein